MIRMKSLGAVALLPALVACQPAADLSDPLRAEFIAGCDGLKEYRSMKPTKRLAYCACIYDQSMAGLSEEEKQYARFYLLEMTGGNSGPTDFLRNGNVNMRAMVVASNAIGNARPKCG